MAGFTGRKEQISIHSVIIGKLWKDGLSLLTGFPYISARGKMKYHVSL